MWIKSMVSLAIVLASVTTYGDETQYVGDQSGQNNEQIESTGSTVAASDSTDNGNAAAQNRNSKCEEEWKRFRESQECFASYGKVGGGVRGEGFEHCTVVAQPAFCD